MSEKLPKIDYFSKTGFINMTETCAIDFYIPDFLFDFHSVLGSTGLLLPIVM